MTLTPERQAILNRAKRVRAEIRKERKAARPKYVREDDRQRAPRERSNTYLQFVRRCPCVACLKAGILETRTVEAAHVRSGFAEDGWRPTGMQEKPDDWRAVPLCRFHHQDGPDAQHKGSERRFWDRLDIHPPALCAALKQAFTNGVDGNDVLRAFLNSTMRKINSAT